MSKFNRLLENADALIAEAARMAKSILAQDALRQAQLQLDDATAYESRTRANPTKKLTVRQK